jgi:hypothetical protein
MTQIKYRPEIDGLRAIAVISVILYHAKLTINGMSLFPGGYLGVDIFFVISGYLISKIVLVEIEIGKFNFRSFYERRARRILPALFFVIIASIPWAYFLMFPKALKEYAGSILASLTFSSNFWFWINDNYWAEPSALKPFLHTWSLSVEEQFYLIFPALILFVSKYAKKQIHEIFTFIFILSFILACLGGVGSEGAKFYLLPTRMWELISGFLIANYELRNNKKKFFYKKIISFIGLLIILFNLIFYRLDLYHSPLITMITILGASFIIGFSQNDLASKILGNKIFVKLGLISYSLYLWHFPIFAFAMIKYPNYSQFDKLIWIVITLVLSVGTYFFIEKPARCLKKTPPKTFFSFLGAIFFILGGVALAFYYFDGFTSRYLKFNQIINLNYWNENQNKNKFFTHPDCWLSRDSIDSIDSSDPFKTCKSYEILDSKNLILVIGDSNAAALVPGLIKFYGRKHIVERVANGCTVGVNPNDEFCFKSIKAGLKEIKKLNPDLIIIGGYQLDKEDVKQLFEYDLKKYLGRLLVMGPLPRWHSNGGLPQKLLEIYEKSYQIPNMLEASKDTFILERHLKQLTDKWGVKYLSPVKTLCVNKNCKTRVGQNSNDITSWDEVHFTHPASIFLVKHNLDLINGFLVKNCDKTIQN